MPQKIFVALMIAINLVAHQLYDGRLHAKDVSVY